MSLFSTEGGGPIGSAVTPVAPVQSKTGDILMTALGSVASYAKTAFTDAEKLEKEKQEEAAKLAGATVVSRFRSELLSIADAVEMGRPVAEVQTLLRKTYGTYQGNNPLLGKELTEAYKDVIGTAGLGKVAVEGTAEQQARAQAEKEAMLAGWNDTDKYLAFKKANSDLAFESSQRSLLNAKLETTSKLTSIESSQIALEETKLRRKQETLVTELADNYHYKFRTDTLEIVNAFKEGKLSAEDALAQLDGGWNTINGLITQGGSKAGSDFLSNVASPMKMSYEQARNVILGKDTVEALNNQTQTNLAIQALMITSNPADARLIATTSLYRNVQFLMMPEIDASVKRIMGSLVTPDGDAPNVFSSNDSKAVETSLKIVRQNMDGIVKGKVKDAVSLEQTEVAINEVLKGVDIYKMSVQAPKQAQAVIDFLAGPEMAAYITKKGGIPSDLALPAKDALTQVYADRVIPLVQEEFKRAVSPTGWKVTGQGFLGGEQTKTPVEQGVVPEFVGSGVRFKAVTPAFNSAAKNLNEKVAPVLDRLIRMGAHLEGGVNYKAVYEREINRILGTEEKKQEEVKP